MSGVWRVTRDAANERERRARVWLAVSRALGDIGLKEPSPLVVCTPEMRTEKLAEDDLFLVLACDGVRSPASPCLELPRAHRTDTKTPRRLRVFK